MWLLLFSLITLSVQQQWEPSQYPNPRKGGFKQCNMRSVSNVCDPDEVLSESARYRLNSELQRISSRTDSVGNSYCERKGVDAVLAIVQQGSQKFVDDLSSLWHMDDQCKKGIIFLLSGSDRRLYFASQSNTGLNDAEIQSVIASNEMHLERGELVPALVNIFKEVGKKADYVTPPSQEEHIRKAASSIICSATFSLLLLFVFSL